MTKKGETTRRRVETRRRATPLCEPHQDVGNPAPAYDETEGPDESDSNSAPKRTQPRRFEHKGGDWNMTGAIQTRRGEFEHDRGDSNTTGAIRTRRRISQTQQRRFESTVASRRQG